MNTGVIGGEADRHSIPAHRISEKTSPSQPCFTPSMLSPGKKPFTGVGKNSHIESGLLMLLPQAERGGVAGTNEKSASRCCIQGEFWDSIRIVGFWYMG